jgi:hypothetical protein
MNGPHLVDYRLDCEWTVSAENHTRKEQADLAIEHAVTTNHDTDSEYREVEEPVTGWADDWPPIE